MDDLLAPPESGFVAGFRPVPSDDTAFDAAIRNAAAACTDSKGAEVLACVTTRLRVRYPDCVLRPQDELAAFPRTLPLIYVFRDG